MPALTKARHEAFARAIVAQLAGKYESQGAAYVAAGYSASTEKNSAESAASRLLKTVKPIATRISELQEIAAKRKRVTIESIVDELEEARDVAKANDQAAAMVQATTGKAKILGLSIDRTEVGKAGDFSQASKPNDVAKQLLRNAGMDESEVSDVACSEALQALAHFNDRIAAIVAGTRQPSPAM